MHSEVEETGDNDYGLYSRCDLESAGAAVPLLVGLALVCVLF